jgi:hypothetical protein
MTDGGYEDEFDDTSIFENKSGLAEVIQFYHIILCNFYIAQYQLLAVRSALYNLLLVWIFILHGNFIFHLYAKSACLQYGT